MNASPEFFHKLRPTILGFGELLLQFAVTAEERSVGRTFGSGQHSFEISNFTFKTLHLAFRLLDGLLQFAASFGQLLLLGIRESTGALRFCVRGSGRRRG